MKKFLKEYILYRWWIPILVCGLGCLLFQITLPSSNYTLTTITDSFLVISIILLIVATIWQFFKGKWYYGLIQVGAIGAIFFWLYIVIFFLVPLGDYDTFADKLEIPDNVELNYPIDLDVGEGKRTYIEELDSLGDKSFQLYNSFQGGLYEYDLWLNTMDSGTVYLRAFEITNNTELSESRLKERSSIRIFDTGGQVYRFGTDSHFTIYEGDWEQFYGARFEVWFEPDNGDEEYKILEKNYVIQGWMR